MTISEHLLKQAIVGTARSDDSTAEHAEQLPAQLAGYAPESRVLLQAAVAALQGTVQLMPLPTQATDIEPAEPDTLEPCGPGALYYLELMLSGLYHELLPEWFYEVSAANRRVPEEALFRLIQLTNKDRDLLEAVAPVIGKRGNWLIEQIGSKPSRMPRFRRNKVEATENIVERIQRAMETLPTDKAQARDMISDICENMEKAELDELRKLHEQLGLLFEHFLDEVIQLRRFRMWGAYLLHDIKETGFAEEMATAATAILDLHSVGFQKQLAVDFKWAGIGDRTEKNAKRRASVQDFIVRGIQWEPEEMLALVAPSFWCAHWEIDADDLILAGRNSEHTHVLFSGWIDATLQFEDVPFAAAMLRHRRLHDLQHNARQTLAALMDTEQLEAIACTWLQRQNRSFDEYHPAVPVLKAHRETWSADLMAEFLATLEQSFQNMKRPLLSPIRHLLRTFVPYFPVAMKDELHRVLMLGQHDELNDNELTVINEFVGLINFRMEMVDAIRN